MRKITIVIMTLLLVSLFALQAFAAGQAKFTVEASDKTVAPGEEVTFTVHVETNTACTSLGFKHAYDSSVWEMIKGECLVTDATLSDFSRAEGTVVLLENPGEFSGALCRFTMRVRDNAAAGETGITGKGAAKNGGQALSPEVISAQITVESDSVKPEQTVPEQPSVESQPVLPTAPDSIVEEETSAATLPETTEPAPTIAERPEPTQGNTSPEPTQEPTELPEAPTETLPNLPPEPEASTQTTQHATDAPADDAVETTEEPLDSADKPSKFPWELMMISVCLVGIAVGVILLVNKNKKSES